MKVYLELRNEGGEYVVKPGWYTQGRAAELMGKAIMTLHSNGAPMPIYEFESMPGLQPLITSA